MSGSHPFKKYGTPRTRAARVRLLKEPFPSASPTRGAFFIEGMLETLTCEDDMVVREARRRRRRRRWTEKCGTENSLRDAVLWRVWPVYSVFFANTTTTKALLSVDHHDHQPMLLRCTKAQRKHRIATNATLSRTTRSSKALRKCQT